MLAPVGKMLDPNEVLDILKKEFLTYTTRDTLTFEDVPAIIWNLQDRFSFQLHKEMVLILMYTAMKPATEKSAPCNQCPFLKGSLQGYFGGNDLNLYTSFLHLDQEVVCHNFDLLEDESRHRICIGSVLTRLNSCKSSRNSESILGISERRLKGSPARGRVFSNSRYFREYHGGN